jgi:hypothetical protein
LITNNSFLLLYTIFFVVLFIGLYFYIQNIRFLHSTNSGELDYAYLNNERIIPLFYYSSLLVLTLIIFGAIYIEDILLLFTWILL